MKMIYRGGLMVLGALVIYVTFKVYQANAARLWVNPFFMVSSLVGSGLITLGLVLGDKEKETEIVELKDEGLNGNQ